MISIKPGSTPHIHDPKATFGKHVGQALLERTVFLYENDVMLRGSGLDDGGIPKKVHQQAERTVKSAIKKTKEAHARSETPNLTEEENRALFVYGCAIYEFLTGSEAINNAPYMAEDSQTNIGLTKGQMTGDLSKGFKVSPAGLDAVVARLTRDNMDLVPINVEKVKARIAGYVNELNAVVQVGGVDLKIGVFQID